VLIGPEGAVEVVGTAFRIQGTEGDIEVLEGPDDF
jgi:hypothetical protein